MTTEEAIKMLKTEKACVERQERKQSCNRYCESCDLCMPIEDVIEGYNMAIKALEQKSRDCKTCIHSYKGNCAGTEECHECMWESKYEQTDVDLISRKAVLDCIGMTSLHYDLARRLRKLPTIPQTDSVLEDIKAEIEKLPRIKVGNSNSPTVKYCIDEVLLYDLLERYKAEKTAEWIFWTSKSAKCSNCGHIQFTNGEDTTKNTLIHKALYHYCPNCGAKMKEGDTK